MHIGFLCILHTLCKYIYNKKTFIIMFITSCLSSFLIAISKFKHIINSKQVLSKPKGQSSCYRYDSKWSIVILWQWSKWHLHNPISFIVFQKTIAKEFLLWRCHQLETIFNFEILFFCHNTHFHNKFIIAQKLVIFFFFKYTKRELVNEIDQITKLIHKNGYS